jgi:hypothetical protein
VHRDVPQKILRRSRLRDDLEAGLLEQARDALARLGRLAPNVRRPELAVQ